MTTNLDRINAYRVANSLEPIAKFRPARHQVMLDTLVAPWEAAQAAATVKPAKADKPAKEKPVAKAAPKADKPAPVAKGTSKKLQVYNLLAAKPISLEDIAKAVGVSEVAARSLIGDLRRDGQTIKSHGKGVFSA
jgi:hypothetical protein